MKELKVVTVKPQTGEIEYGIAENGRWLRHGLVIERPMTGETSLHALETAAAADAIAQGWFEPD